MRVLVLYCHPNPASFSAHLRDRVLSALARERHETRLVDLYGQGFDPVMSLDERLGYHTPGDNEVPVADHLADLRWAEGIVFLYPTWWFGLPAMLKGWLDRVLVPHATFAMPTEDKPMQSKLANIRLVVCITTCGARWWQMKYIGEPGRRTLLRGFRTICHPRCATRFAALYRIDTTREADRLRFAGRVERMMQAI